MKGIQQLKNGSLPPSDSSVGSGPIPDTNRSDSFPLRTGGSSDTESSRDSTKGMSSTLETSKPKKRKKRKLKRVGMYVVCMEEKLGKGGFSSGIGRLLVMLLTHVHSLDISI